MNENLRRLIEATPSAINTARDTLLEACGLDVGETSWTELRHMAVTLEPAVTEPHLLAFLRRITQAGMDSSGIESVLALVASRPPHNWSDADVDRFPEAAAATGRAFREAVRSTGSQATAEAQLAKLTPKERRQAEDILTRVRNYLHRNANDASPRAIQAAMIRLLEELEL